MSQTSFLSILTGQYRPLVAIACLAVSPTKGVAQSPLHSASAQRAVTSTPAANSIYEQLWSLPVLYKNDANPWIEQFSIIGRYQGQYFATDSNAGEDEDYENRRLRVGIKMLMLDKKLTLNAEVQTNDRFDPLYDNLTDVFAEYKPDPHWQFRVGKWQPHFGHEFGISSREIITFERGALVNQMGIFFMPGSRLGYTHGKWTAMLAGFSNKTDKEFGDFDGGFSSLLSLARDVHQEWSLDAGEVRFDWLHSDSRPTDNRLNFFTDSFSLNWRLKDGHAGFNGDIIAATGPRGDAFGLTLMPTWQLSPKVELVTRYQFSSGSESNVLRPLPRYERAAGATAGDLYQAAYVGVNYYLYGHRLKFMTGLEYATLTGGTHDFNGWTWLGGVRVYF